MLHWQPMTDEDVEWVNNPGKQEPQKYSQSS